MCLKHLLLYQPLEVSLARKLIVILHPGGSGAQYSLPTPSENSSCFYSGKYTFLFNFGGKITHLCISISFMYLIIHLFVEALT